MSHPSPASPQTNHRLLAILVLIVCLYGVGLIFGWPQAATRTIVSEAATAHEHARDKPEPPPLWTVIPFVLLLGAIAVLPLLSTTQHCWENNRNRFFVAAGLGLVVLAYYAVAHRQPVERHFLSHELVEREPGTVSWSLPAAVFQNAILGEYVPFIVLLFALYTISGGIRITGDLPARPITNMSFLAVGGLLASFIGTTGAAMVLIRPLLETNSERKHVAHTVVFFIFIVCNCGGCLLPIGDPPLFLGYLQGVDFWWTLSLWQEWAFVNSALLAIYYLWDRFYAYPHESPANVTLDEGTIRRLQIQGLWPNALLLGLIVLAVALLDPSKPVPFTNWHPWFWLREVVQLALVALSLWLGSSAIRRDNRFSYAAIVEVAALFVGIFICMQPALQILDVRGAPIRLTSPTKFFWVTGSISAVLDNAPTYLVFFKTAQALPSSGPSQAGVPVDTLAAISLGAVFMGAMTYIGNGPNFMVKAIAEEAGVKMPSFFGYVVYSALVLLPVLIVLDWLFL